jgi:hypothetical protein
MSSGNEVDKRLLEFARQVAAIPRRISEGDRAPSDAPVAAVTIAPAPVSAPVPPILAKETVEAPAEQTPAVMTKQTDSGPAINTARKLCTPEELANRIMETLRQVGDLPSRGFVITVYGSNPWNALLTVRPEAGPFIDRTLWSSRVQDIVGRLRNEFDIAGESSHS